MEHRWGARVRTNVTARVDASSHSFHLARLTDLSISGAFLRIGLPVDELHPIHVELAPSGSQKRSGVAIEAYVVRRTDEGVGIEWAEFGPIPVLQLLASLSPYAPHAQFEKEVSAASTEATVSPLRQSG